jgi:hypothetical protein
MRRRALRDLLTASRGNALWQANETEFGSSCLLVATRSNRATFCVVDVKGLIVAAGPRGKGCDQT